MQRVIRIGIIVSVVGIFVALAAVKTCAAARPATGGSTFLGVFHEAPKSHELTASRQERWLVGQGTGPFGEHWNLFQPLSDAFLGR